MSEYKEIDGEILPSYTGPNAPRYLRGDARDTEMPHDFGDVDAPEGDVHGKVFTNLRHSSAYGITATHDAFEGDARPYYHELPEIVIAPDIISAGKRGVEAARKEIEATVTKDKKHFKHS